MYTTVGIGLHFNSGGSRPGPGGGLAPSFFVQPPSFSTDYLLVLPLRGPALQNVLAWTATAFEEKYFTISQVVVCTSYRPTAYHWHSVH